MKKGTGKVEVIHSTYWVCIWIMSQVSRTRAKVAREGGEGIGWWGESTHAPPVLRPKKKVP